MTARQILEMLDKGKVDGSPAQRADDRHGLRHHLLGYDDAEPRGDLREKPDEGRGALAHRTLVERKIGELDDPSGEQGADHEVVAVRHLAIAP